MLQFMKELFRSVATIAIVVAVAMDVCLVAMQCNVIIGIVVEFILRELLLLLLLMVCYFL